MTPDSLVAQMLDTGTLLPLALGLLSGALIGFEREYQGKSAGLRTHTLVSFASALMTVLGLRTAEWASAFPTEIQIVTDMARMPHAILTGVGFLCAGVIFREGASVHGLTTAASLWLAAALGIVFGTGMLELGAIGTAMALAVLVLLRVLQAVTPPRPQARIEIAVRAEGGLDGAALVAVLTGQGLRPGPLSIHQDTTHGLRRYRLLVSARSTAIGTERLADLLLAHPGIRDLSIVPLENDMVDDHAAA